MQKLAGNTLLLLRVVKLHVSLKRSFKVFNHFKRELSDWLHIELAPAGRANRLRLSLKPTKRLSNLLAATEALCVNRDSGGLATHKSTSQRVSRNPLVKDA